MLTTPWIDSSFRSIIDLLFRLACYYELNWLTHRSSCANADNLRNVQITGLRLGQDRSKIRPCMFTRCRTHLVTTSNSVSSRSYVLLPLFLLVVIKFRQIFKEPHGTLVLKLFKLILYTVQTGSRTIKCVLSMNASIEYFSIEAF